jgi:hypothetical protein
MGLLNKHWSRHGQTVVDTVPPPTVSKSPDYTRARPHWTGTRYEYMLLTALPLGDPNQRDLSQAGQHGWRVVQVGMEESALGYATGVWALLERELLPAQSDQVPFMDAHGYHRPDGSGPGDQRGGQPPQPEPNSPFWTRRLDADRPLWRGGQPDNL